MRTKCGNIKIAKNVRLGKGAVAPKRHSNKISGVSRAFRPCSTYPLSRLAHFLYFSLFSHFAEIFAKSQKMGRERRQNEERARKCTCVKKPGVSQVTKVPKVSRFPHFFPLAQLIRVPISLTFHTFLPFPQFSLNAGNLQNPPKPEKPAKTEI